MVERTLSYSYVYLLVDKTMCNQKRRPKGGDFLCARFPSCVFLCARIPSCGIEKWYDIAFRTYVPARTRSVDRNMNINCERPYMSRIDLLLLLPVHGSAHEVDSTLSRFTPTFAMAAQTT